MPIQKIEDLRAELQVLEEECRGLADKDEITDEEDARLDAALEESKEIRAQIERLEARKRKVEEVRAYAAQGNTEAGEDRGPQVIVKPGKDEIFDVSSVRSDSEFRDRAMRVMEFNDERLNDASKERIEDLTRNAGKALNGQRDTAADIARHLMVTGTPEYADAFRQYMVGNPVDIQRYANEHRTAMSLTDGNGGYMVPFPLDPTLVITNDGTVNPFRQIGAIKTTTADTWNGVTSAGVTAEWIAEAQQVADGSPTTGAIAITPLKADAYVQASMELVQDSNIENELGALFQDAKDRLESTAFAVGNGVTQPQGIVTAASGSSQRVDGSSGAAGAADLVPADIYALDNALAPRHRANASFVANKATWNAVRQFGTANAYHAFWTDFGGGLPPQLIGYPVYESSAMDSTRVSGSNDDIIVLGDFKKFYIVDRVGMSLFYEPLVKGANARPTGEVGWVVFWRTTSKVADVNAFRTLRV
jgi:HK97 family phage major capsid protein